MNATIHQCSECGRTRETEQLAEACCTFQSPFMPVEVGEFISIPAWDVTGQVTSVAWDQSGLGSDSAIAITLQQTPGGRERRYRLEPNEYTVIA